MKTQLTLILFLFISMTLSAQKIAVAGSGNPFIHIIDKNTGQVEWIHPLNEGEECNSVAITREGHILYSYSKGARLITRDHAIIWDIKGGEGSEVQSASILEMKITC
ncbi:MAG: hypothetical protein LIP01_12860 [Tannerellaceae bacterium]|nr:hypothetical protein [Tannerellaceae bacterium]